MRAGAEVTVDDIVPCRIYRIHTRQKWLRLRYSALKFSRAVWWNENISLFNCVVGVKRLLHSFVFNISETMYIAIVLLVLRLGNTSCISYLSHGQQTFLSIFCSQKCFLPYLAFIMSKFCASFFGILLLDWLLSLRKLQNCH